MSRTGSDPAAIRRGGNCRARRFAARGFGEGGWARQAQSRCAVVIWVGVLAGLMGLGAGQAQGADAVRDMMAKLALYEDCIVESPDLVSDAARAKQNCAPRLDEALMLLHEGSVADVRAQMNSAVQAFIDDNSPASQSVYRLSVDLPDVPTGGETTENHVPTGWQTAEPEPTATESVFSVSRNVFRSDGSFVSATAWANLTLVAANVPVITTVVETIYKLSATAPAAPSGGRSTENHHPTGWLRQDTAPEPTETQAVYSATRTVTFSNGAFESATAWGNVTLVHRAVPITRASHTFLVNNHRPPMPSAAGTYAFGRDGNAYSLSATERATSSIRDEIPTWRELHDNASLVSIALLDRNSVNQRSAHDAIEDALESKGEVTLSYRVVVSGLTREIKFRVASAAISANAERCNLVFEVSDANRTINAAATSIATRSIADGNATVQVDTVVGGVTTWRQTIFRRASSAPAAPTGGESTETHLPTGWSTTRSAATVTSGVYSSERTVTYRHGDFDSASAWGAVELVESPIEVGTRSQAIYQYVVGSRPATPARPTGGQSTEHHVPSGWSKTRTAPTAAGTMFRSIRTVTYHNNVFHAATSWGSVTNYAKGLREFVYRRAASTPATPTGGERTASHVPSGWSTTQPDATTTQGVYRAVRYALNRTGGTFLLASSWGSVTQVAVPVTPVNETYTFRVNDHRPPTPNGRGGYAFIRDGHAYSLSATERTATNIRDEIPTWGELYSNATGVSVAVTDRNGVNHIEDHRKLASAVTAGSTIDLTYTMSGRELTFRVTGVMLSGNNLRCNFTFATTGRSRNSAAVSAASTSIADGSATVEVEVEEN